MRLAEKKGQRYAAEKVGIPRSSASQQYKLVELTPELRAAVTQETPTWRSRRAQHARRKLHKLLLELLETGRLRAVHVLLTMLMIGFGANERLSKLWIHSRKAGEKR